MIHVEPQPEPPSFDKAVRQPGLRALAEKRDPLPPHWRECLDDLRAAYRGICAYLCVWVPYGTGARSVDHVAPKSLRPELAYEWSNYRFASLLMNSRKREFDDVLDPFEIPDGWFVLDLSFLQVLPGASLDQATRDRVQAAIDRLQLNDPECIKARGQFYDVYLDGGLTFAQLMKWSPFVAKELIRQGLVPQPPQDPEDSANRKRLLEKVGF